MPALLPAAMIGASVIGAGASIISGNKAAKAQKAAADQQVTEARRQYDTDRADLAPWRTTGGAAIAKLGSIYGLDGSKPNNTGTGPNAYGGFFSSPDYQFRKDESLKALDRYRSSQGLLNSGATRIRAEGMASDLASSEYGNWYNRLAGLAGAGQSAANSTVAAGQNSSNNIINAYGQAGNANASAYANVGSSINSGINNVLSAYLFSKGGGFGKTGGKVGF